VYWNAVDDQTTPTPADVSVAYADLLVVFSAWSRITRTSTPAFFRAIRSLTAVVSLSSYIVMSMLERAESMNL
jgi:hypothetical protein